MIFGQGEEVTNEKIIEYIQSLYSYIQDKTEKIALYTENKERIFSNFEEIDNIKENNFFNKETENYFLKKIEDKNYMIFSSYWSINNEVIYIVNIYDITSIYQERDRQMKEIMYTDVIILIISSIFISIFSILLTMPINKLNQITKKIASGQFNERIEVKSKDEIGELANNFNMMSEQIENKINLLNISIKQKDDFINRIHT